LVISLIGGKRSADGDELLYIIFSICANNSLGDPMVIS